MDHISMQRVQYASRSQCWKLAHLIHDSADPAMAEVRSRIRKIPYVRDLWDMAMYGMTFVTKAEASEAIKAALRSDAIKVEHILSNHNLIEKK